MKRLFAVVVCLSAFAASFAQGGDCSRNSLRDFEDLGCALEARDAADAELNATYQRLMGVIDPAEREVLRKAQRAWLAYVAADAKFIFAREGDGSSGRLVAVNARTRLTRERIEVLKSWLPRS